MRIKYLHDLLVFFRRLAIELHNENQIREQNSNFNLDFDDAVTLLMVVSQLSYEKVRQLITNHENICCSCMVNSCLHLKVFE